MKEKTDLRLAVLIDADNAPPGSLGGIMAEIAARGNPTIKRIYGDWTTPALGGWKKKLLEYAITPIQQYGYTTGKNSTDSAMIIDAMDLLYSGRADGFCIVSSDSDFTRLATRLREAGMFVIGMGERKTPKPFIVSCDKFVYLEVLGKEDNGAEEEPHQAQKPAAPKKKKPAAPAAQVNKVPIDEELISLIAATIDDVADDEGWANLGEVGSVLQKKMPDFDSRNYGFSKLSNLIRSSDSFELDAGKSAQGGTFSVSVKRD